MRIGCNPLTGILRQSKINIKTNEAKLNIGLESRDNGISLESLRSLFDPIYVCDNKVDFEKTFNNTEDNLDSIKQIFMRIYKPDSWDISQRSSDGIGISPAYILKRIEAFYNFVSTEAKATERHRYSIVSFYSEDEHKRLKYNLRFVYKESNDKSHVIFSKTVCATNDNKPACPGMTAVVDNEGNLEYQFNEELHYADEKHLLEVGKQIDTFINRLDIFQQNTIANRPRLRNTATTNNLGPRDSNKIQISQNVFFGTKHLNDNSSNFEINYTLKHYAQTDLGMGKTWRGYLWNGNRLLTRIIKVLHTKPNPITIESAPPRAEVIIPSDIPAKVPEQQSNLSNESGVMLENNPYDSDEIEVEEIAPQIAPSSDPIEEAMGTNLNTRSKLHSESAPIYKQILTAIQKIFSSISNWFKELCSFETIEESLFINPPIEEPVTSENANNPLEYLKQEAPKHLNKLVTLNRYLENNQTTVAQSLYSLIIYPALNYQIICELIAKIERASLLEATLNGLRVSSRVVTKTILEDKTTQKEELDTIYNQIKSDDTISKLTTFVNETAFYNLESCISTVLVSYFTIKFKFLFICNYELTKIPISQMNYDYLKLLSSAYNKAIELTAIVCEFKRQQSNRKQLREEIIVKYGEIIIQYNWILNINYRNLIETKDNTPEADLILLPEIKEALKLAVSSTSNNTSTTSISSQEIDTNLTNASTSVSPVTDQTSGEEIIVESAGK